MLPNALKTGRQIIDRLNKKQRIGLLVLCAAAVLGIATAFYMSAESGVDSELLEERTKLGLTEDDGLLGKMRAQAAQAEIALLQREQWRAVMELLYMRGDEKDFIVRRDEALIGEHEKYGNLLVQEIAQSGMSDEEKKFATEKVEAYRQYFTEVAESVRKIAALTKEEAAPPEASGEEGWPWRGIAIIGILLTVGASAAYVRFSLRPVGRLARYMEAFAAGDFGEEVPYAGRGGAVGKMASAVRTFKGNLFQQATHVDDEAEFAEQILENVDVLAEASNQLATAGRDIRRQAEEVVRVSHSVSDEVAEINSHILALAEKMDSISAALKPETKEASAKVDEIKGKTNEAVSKILFVNDVVQKAKELSKEIAEGVERHGAATRDIVRGIKHVASAIQKRVKRE